MTVRAVVATSIALVCAVAILRVEVVRAQVPAGSAPPPTAAPARPAAAAAAARPANVRQLMRGLLFPNSNVIFAAQADDPEAVPKAPDSSLSPNPLASVYGGWEAVANSALALTESARLFEVARVCSNGKPAPIASPTWKKGLAQLRAAGQDAYKAAQAKSNDAVLDASDKITTACSTCHEKYREKPVRCVE